MNQSTNHDFFIDVATLYGHHRMTDGPLEPTVDPPNRRRLGLGSNQLLDQLGQASGAAGARRRPRRGLGRALGPARPGRALRAPAAVRATVLQFHASFTRDPRGISLFFLYFLTSLMIHDKK